MAGAAAAPPPRPPPPPPPPPPPQKKTAAAAGRLRPSLQPYLHRLPLALACSLGMEIFTGDFKTGLEELLQQTHVQAIVLGTRRWAGAWGRAGVLWLAAGGGRPRCRFTGSMRKNMRRAGGCAHPCVSVLHPWVQGRPQRSGPGDLLPQLHRVAALHANQPNTGLVVPRRVVLPAGKAAYTSGSTHTHSCCYLCKGLGAAAVHACMCGPSCRQGTGERGRGAAVHACMCVGVPTLQTAGASLAPAGPRALAHSCAAAARPLCLPCRG